MGPVVLAVLLLQSTVAIVRSSSACSSQGVAALVTELFSTLGHDCSAYVSLFSPNAVYYHQHDGYKTYGELLKTCQAYAAFCPGSTCKFRQEGAVATVQRSSVCHVLAPYIWSEVPANHQLPGNLEPHTGWEYILATPDTSSFAFAITHFAEVETSYAAAFNRGNPLDVSVYNWTVELLKGTASEGECDRPVAEVITKAIAAHGPGWRQQGEAVVLAAGGLCHVVVPHAAEDEGVLTSGHVLFVLRPAVVPGGYTVEDSVVFAR